MPPPSEAEALAALERLYRRNLVTLDQAKAAARLITGNDAIEFPPREEPAPSP